jgi:hypothetical protein
VFETFIFFWVKTVIRYFAEVQNAEGQNAEIQICSQQQNVDITNFHDMT